MQCLTMHIEVCWPVCHSSK